jgi:hypothetical protein
MNVVAIRSATSPLSLQRHLPERSSPSRVRLAAQNRRALDRCGPFRKLFSEKGKGAHAKSTPPSVCNRVQPPVGRYTGLTKSMLTRRQNPKIRPPPTSVRPLTM